MMETVKKKQDMYNILVIEPEVPVIIITGYSTVDTAVDAMKNGAFDNIAKPFTSDLIIDKAQKAIDHKVLAMEGFSEKNDGRRTWL